MVQNKSCKRIWMSRRQCRCDDPRDTVKSAGLPSAPTPTPGTKGLPCCTRTNLDWRECGESTEPSAGSPTVLEPRGGLRSIRRSDTLADRTFAEVNNTKGPSPGCANGKFNGICGLGVVASLTMVFPLISNLSCPLVLQAKMLCFLLRHWRYRRVGNWWC